MRLLRRDHQGHFVFTDDLHEPPPYAILAHTWGPKEKEVLYEDIIHGTAAEKEAYHKLEFIADQAAREELDHFWIDTCCIDKRDHTELSTAIRSMFRWYKNSAVCFVYLSDVSSRKRKEDGTHSWEEAFQTCRWFKRGWTLQELIAPKRVDFYARGQYLGSRAELCGLIQGITHVNIEGLEARGLEAYPFPIRLQWANDRDTTVPEDIAYALMGLCNISMTPQYGEGRLEARRRLERKIVKRYGENALDRPLHFAQGARGVPELRDRTFGLRKSKLEMLGFETMHSRRTAIKRALQHTCDWILTHTAYEEWLRITAIRRHYGFLWVKGKPGAGKSVLVKYLDNYTSQTINQEDLCLPFYFNARGEKLEKSVVGLYRSLLVQLLRAVPESQKVLDDAGKITGESDATIKELQRLLLNAILSLKDRRTFCFIDALDECKEHDVQQMIEYFCDLGQQAIDEEILVNVCFASRHYPTLEIPTGLQLVLEKIDEHENDLKKYVESQRFQIGATSGYASIPVKIQEKILLKANGVFLWIVLVVDILKREFRTGRIHAVARRLEEIPTGLSELFQDIVQRDRNNIDDFMLCLQWILHAERPLEPSEFYFAMMAGIEGQNLEQSSIADMGTDADRFIRGFVLDSSKGLAELMGDPPTVQFIHESVRDFLLAGDGFLYISRGQESSAARSHEILKKCCLRGVPIEWECNKEKIFSRSIAIEDIETPSDPYKRRTMINRCLPFFEYATSFLFNHANGAATEISQEEFLSNVDLDNWVDCANELPSETGLSFLETYQKPLDLFFLCAARNLTNLIGVLARMKYSISEPGKQSFESPLFVAIAKKSKDAGRLLLELDGAPNSDEIVHEVITKNHKGELAYKRSETALSWQWAVEQMYEGLALHLLITDPDSKYCTVRKKEIWDYRRTMIEATISGCRKLFAALLSCSVDSRDWKRVLQASHPDYYQGGESTVPVRLAGRTYSSPRGAHVFEMFEASSESYMAPLNSTHNPTVCSDMISDLHDVTEKGACVSDVAVAVPVERIELVQNLGRSLTHPHITAEFISAFGGSKWDTVQLLLNQNPGLLSQNVRTTFRTASGLTLWELFTALVADGGGLILSEEDFTDAIDGASARGLFHCIAWLLFCDIPRKMQGQKFSRALHISSAKGFPWIAELLLRKHPDLQVKHAKCKNSCCRAAVGYRRALRKG